MSKKDYYKILGVSKNATDKEIKTAYRKLAMMYHPDKLKDGTSDAKMQELNEAYEVLSDKQKRENYDRYGSEDGPQGFEGFGGFGGFGDIFSSFFGGGFGSQRNTGPIRGDDQLASLTISFNDAIKGIEITQLLYKWEQCSICHGKGSQNPSDIITCSMCNGSGHRQIQQRTPFGIINSTTTCSSCGGQGKINKNPCSGCKGNLTNKVQKQVKFNIAPGTDNGERIKITGYGSRGENGGPNGDLYIEIKVQKHKHFERDGLNLYLEYPVSFMDIIKENNVLVPTPYGNETIKLKKSYQNGKTLILNGKGVRKSNRAGDLKILLKVVIPDLSNSEMNRLAKSLEEFNDTTNTDYIKSFN
ncbi:Chaperone protein DnaJ [Mycoplasmopsis bovigenitalium 51080]|uniref:Chaperone protein DnaJ n=1 Tax=Mycoplasmopsis bovigenitalium 51080 TaxID=1188235 RepID=N9VBQ1_9BACT|nr:DnaJ C-terminal domain-containing protein [Mycoplasmopsis bovigenitalium]ENY69108.1 Chaperone protein DnaJ [Mycoplasmopsis bovigenitalium 51080]